MATAVLLSGRMERVVVVPGTWKSTTLCLLPVEGLMPKTICGYFAERTIISMQNRSMAKSLSRGSVQLTSAPEVNSTGEGARVNYCPQRDSLRRR